MVFPSHMWAFLVSDDAERSLVRREVAVPELRAGEVLVRVRAAGVNRADVLQRRGLYPPPKGVTEVPGLELSGEIMAVGDGVSGWSVGDKVCSIVAGGAYAEYCAVPAAQLMRIPAGFDFVKAAAVPEVFTTVWQTLFQEAEVQAGEVALVHGGSSGIGTAAIQLLKAFGVRVLVTAGSADKCAFCEKLGAERAINYKEENFVEVVKEVTEGRGADVILDMVGGDYIERNFKAAALGARIVVISFLRGAKAEVHFASLLMKRLKLMGSTLRSRSVEEKGQLAQALQDKVWPLLESGAIQPVIDSVYPMNQVMEAHVRMESGLHMGKIVLEVG